MPLALKKVPATDPDGVSPKVTRPAWAVLLLAGMTGILEAVTPDMLDFLGDWKATAYMVAGVLLQVIVGYRAQDPARAGVAEPEPEPEAEPEPEPEHSVVG